MDFIHFTYFWEADFFIGNKYHKAFVSSLVYFFQWYFHEHFPFKKNQQNEKVSARCEIQKNMKTLNTQIQMRKGILEFCILHIISRGEVYATDMIEELKEAKLLVVEGTLYPLLNQLKKEGLVTYKWVESDSGPPRKYYSLTPYGADYLNQLNETWGNMNKSVKKILFPTNA